MPGAVEEDTSADQVKVFKTEGEDGEQQASVLLKDDKADISFRAEIERDKPDTALPSTSQASLPTSKSHSLGSKQGTAFSSPGKGIGPVSGASNSYMPIGIDPHAWAAAHFGPLHNMNGLNAALAAQAASPGQYFFLPHISPAWGQQFSLPGAAAASPFAAQFGFGGPGRNSGATPPALSLACAQYAMGLSPTYAHAPFIAHGLSPSFMDPSLMALASSRQGYGSPMLGSSAASPVNLSPLHSPSTGAPIGPTLHLQNKQADPMALNKASPVSLPATFAHWGMRGLSTNPLQSIARLPVPQVTGPSHMASSLAAQQHKHNERNSEKMRREDKMKPHVKKPLNAFMIFMKENRAKLMQEKGYKERQSAELNKELGRLWHTLSQEEQQKYYVMSRDARNEHMKNNPGWTARDNYAIHKKRKRKRDKTMAAESNELKKCRARFGLDQQSKWCKHCRRKKKCLAFREAELAMAKSEDGSPPAHVTSTTQGSPGASSGGGGPTAESVGSPTSSAGRPVVSSSSNFNDDHSTESDSDEEMSDRASVNHSINVTLVPTPTCAF